MSAPPRLIPEKCTSCVYEALYLENRGVHIHEERCTPVRSAACAYPAVPRVRCGWGKPYYLHKH